MLSQRREKQIAPHDPAFRVGRSFVPLAFNSSFRSMNQATKSSSCPPVSFCFFPAARADRSVIISANGRSSNGSFRSVEGVTRIRPFSRMSTRSGGIYLKRLTREKRRRGRFENTLVAKLRTWQASAAAAQTGIGHGDFSCPTKVNRDSVPSRRHIPQNENPPHHLPRLLHPRGGIRGCGGGGCEAERHHHPHGRSGLWRTMRDGQAYSIERGFNADLYNGSEWARPSSRMPMAQGLLV